jgi:hypothetical protein
MMMKSKSLLCCCCCCLDTLQRHFFLLSARRLDERYAFYFEDEGRNISHTSGDAITLQHSSSLIELGVTNPS